MESPLPNPRGVGWGIGLWWKVFDTAIDDLHDTWYIVVVLGMRVKVEQIFGAVS